jgi:hypothetical protein
MSTKWQQNENDCELPNVIWILSSLPVLYRFGFYTLYLVSCTYPLEAVVISVGKGYSYTNRGIFAFGQKGLCCEEMVA